ncbi:MAG: acetamidase/formamidase family protein [Deltaproteobacteria bacterium]|nr:acetamidase/formamidase family protein [Deltaproteobacteria bacterium]
MSHKLHEIRLDQTKRLSAQPAKGHNRWHPAIPPVLTVDPGDEVMLDTLDALDCQIEMAAGLESASRWDLNAAHPLTGPISVNEAEAGDLLEVQIAEITPGQSGWTAQLPGFGFLRDLFPEPHLVRWRLRAGYAESDDLPGVRLPEASFPGVIGVAPSLAQLERILSRERIAAERGGMVMPPEPRSALPALEPVLSQGLRTIPPRETGGNLDVKQLVQGTSIYLPVWTRGALLSIGDAHFAQGDGEVCGSAIEMAATFRLQFKLHKRMASERRIRGVQFTGTERALPARRYYATTGLSMRGEDLQESEDATLAARNALLAMIDYLQQRGFNRQQAYAICSVAVDLKVSEVVDVPNFVVTAFLSLDIFS